ncbi:hypothetical protein K438DRAFT_1967225 [Mycena galopus ATCC 62051]|nr:hypothetical protein K438DRAFT_1967225 [Mycena galopus ATCC 62051]
MSPLPRAHHAMRHPLPRCHTRTQTHCSPRLTRTPPRRDSPRLRSHPHPHPHPHRPGAPPPTPTLSSRSADTRHTPARASPQLHSHACLCLHSAQTGHDSRPHPASVLVDVVPGHAPPSGDDSTRTPLERARA